ncbi:MAG: hypothetical protein OEY74_03615, partial [Gammaproteobacteria bacterium]|nr:hypothetical protein [Gammaproteobacteria bacterium]
NEKWANGPFLPSALVAVRANTPDNKKPLSGAFTHRYSGGALVRDYTVNPSIHATLNPAYFNRRCNDKLPAFRRPESDHYHVEIERPLVT